MDDQSFDALYRAWYTPLWRFARTLAQTDADAHDCVQDVFAVVLSRGDAVVVETSIEAYLFRAVRNAALDRVRHERVVEHAQDTQHGIAVAMGERQPLPDAAAELDDTMHRLISAIRTLPERQRTAIILRWRSGLTAADVGRVMGISDTAARKLLASAEHKLRPLL